MASSHFDLGDTSGRYLQGKAKRRNKLLLLLWLRLGVTSSPQGNSPHGAVLKAVVLGRDPQAPGWVPLPPLALHHIQNRNRTQKSHKWHFQGQSFCEVQGVRPPPNPCTPLSNIQFATLACTS